MDVGIDECHCGLTSCQGQRPVLVLIPVNGIVTQNFELQSFTFHQGPVLKEIVHYANSFLRRIAKSYLKTCGGFQVKQLTSDFG